MKFQGLKTSLRNVEPMSRTTQTEDAQALEHFSWVPNMSSRPILTLIRLADFGKPPTSVAITLLHLNNTSEIHDLSMPMHRSSTISKPSSQHSFIPEHLGSNGTFPKTIPRLQSNDSCEGSGVWLQGLLKISPTAAL